LVILSPSSANSTNVEDEINFALEEHKTVIPVFYEDCKVPFQLRSLQYVDFRLDYVGGLKVLLKTLGVEPVAVASVAEGRRHPQRSEAAFLDNAKGKSAADQAELDSAESRGPSQSELASSVSRSPDWMKIAGVVSGLVIVALLLYWISQPKRPDEGIQKSDIKTDTSNRPASAEVSSGSAPAENAGLNRPDGRQPATDNVGATSHVVRQQARQVEKPLPSDALFRSFGYESTLKMIKRGGDGMAIPRGGWREFSVQVLDMQDRPVQGASVAWQQSQTGSYTYVGISDANGYVRATNMFTSSSGGSFIEEAYLVAAGTPTGFTDEKQVRRVGPRVEFAFTQ